MDDKPLKIAVLSVHSSPLGRPGAKDTGGMSIYIRELTRELAARGHAVDIFTRSPSSSLPEIVQLTPGVRLIHIQAGDGAELDKLLIYSHAPDLACKAENYRKAHDLEYDIIFSHYWISGISGLYLQTWWQVPHLVMFHTLGAVKNAIGIGEDEPELRIQEEGLIARECSGVLASTQKEKTFLNNQYSVSAEKISVVPCGVNTETFYPMDKAQAKQELRLGSEKIILFVGRIERLKGIDRLIRAMPYLAGLKPRLLVVGEDGHRKGEIDNLKKLAANAGIADSVTFAGQVEYADLPLYYNAADVCVFPSYYESFGLVPLESLACGTPVVTSDVGDLRNIVLEDETGYVLPNGHPEQFAEKIGKILTRKALNSASQQSIRESITCYSWRNIANSVAAVLCRMVTRDPIQV